MLNRKNIAPAIVALTTLFLFNNGNAQNASRETLWTFLPGTQASPAFFDANAVRTSPENANWRIVTLLNQPMDNQTPPRPIAQSMTVDITIDCNQKSSRTEEMRLHDQPYGKGNVTESMYEAGEFIPVELTEPNIFLLDNICK